jgi:eukaryotic-like serine/threonine-protein kinase
LEKPGLIMMSARSCPKCGTILDGQGVGGLCAKCLLLSGLEPAGVPPEPDEPARQQIRYFGDYELLEEVASGGMGVVYKARQKSLNRVLAIKLLLFGKFSHPDFVKRFRAEAAAAASLQHPNIVAIHEVGEHDGQPYFSMDFVEGSNLAEAVREHPLPPKQAALYLKIIADAIHFAHTKGVLHRDLKPSNVLLDQFDQPRITDFGLAKQLHEESQLTITGQVLGSPGYMPPEQASGRRDALGPPSDVYSVGAILFHLLTGRPPFVSDSVPEVLQQVLRAEPVSPRLLNPGVPRDLETICLKCLEKESQRRYHTARELSEELTRFLRDEPIRARPIGSAGRLWRWARRHPATAGLSAAVLLMLGAVAVTSTVAAVRISRAERGRVEKLRESYLAQAQAYRRTAEAGYRFKALQAVKEAAQLHPPPSLIPGLRSEAIAALALVDVRPAAVWEVKSDRAPHTWVFNRALDRYAYLTFEAGKQALHVGRTDDHAELGRIAFDQAAFANVSAMSEDGRFVALMAPGPRHSVYDTVTGKLALSNEVAGFWIEFIGNKNLLAGFGPKRQLIIWDVAAGTILRTIDVPRETGTFSFSPDGSRFALELGRRVEVRETDTEQTTYSFTLPMNAMRLAWSGDNTRLIAATSDRQAITWRAEKGDEVKVLSGAAGGIINAALHSGERFILTLELDRTVRLWDMVRSQPILAIDGTGTTIHFSSDGKRFGPIWLGERLTIYEIVKPSVFERLAPDMPLTRFGELAWNPDGRLLALSAAGRVQLWDAHLAQPLGTLAVPAISEAVLHWWKVNRSRPVYFDSDGALWAEAADELVRWPARFTEVENNAELRVGPAELLPFAALSNRWPHVAGAWLARGFPGIKAPDSSRDHSDSNHGPVFASLSPGGHQLVSLTRMNFATAQVTDRTSGATVATLPVDHARAVQFSPDGRWLVVAGRRYDIWDAHRWSRVLTIENGAHDMADGSADFSPDGRLLALVQNGKQVELRMAGSWEAIAKLQAPDHIGIEQIRFNPDSTRLAASGPEGSVHVWDLQKIASELVDLGLDWPLPRPASPHRANARPLRLRAIAAVPSRAASTSRQHIDLSDHYNAGFEDQWFGQRWTLAKLQPGLRTFGSIEFDVRGVVQLSPVHTQLTGSLFPSEAKGIEISQTARRLHFLHGCVNRATPGTPVARYRVHYANGERLEIPVIYGEQVRDTLFVRASPTQASHASIVWQSDCDNLPGNALRLFHFVWENPHPNVEIQRLDFVSALSSSAPFLVALTLE